MSQIPDGPHGSRVNRSPPRLRRHAARTVLIMWTAMAYRTRIGIVVGTIKEGVTVFSA